MAITENHCGYSVEGNIGLLFTCEECGRETVVHNSESECLRQLRLIGWHIDERCAICAPCVDIVRRRLERYHREDEEKHARLKHHNRAGQSEMDILKKIPRSSLKDGFAYYKRSAELHEAELLHARSKLAGCREMRDELVGVLQDANAIEEGELIVEAVRRLAHQGMGDLSSVECPNCKDWPTDRHVGDGLDCERCNNTKKVLAMEVG